MEPMKELHINFMNNLQNIQFAKLYNQICISVESELLEKGNDQEACQNVKNQVAEINQMLPDPLIHELTVVVNKKVRIRTNYLISLRKQVEGLKITYCENKISAAIVLSYWLEKQSGKLYRPSITSQSRLVENLMHEREQNTEIDAAITFLRLDGLIAAIDVINKEIDANFMQRNKELSARTKKSKAIRKAAYNDLRLFVSSINLFVGMHKKKNEDTIYHQYSREINNLLISYNTKQKSKNTKRKNKKEITVAVEEMMNRQEEQQKTLPVGVSQELTRDLSTGSGTDKVKNEKLKTNPGDVVSDVKTNSEDLSITKNDGNIGKKNDEGKLPPINRN